MSNSPALAVDLQGLAKLVERRGKSFAILELVQNAWDEDVTRVDVTLKYIGYNRAHLMVTDDSPDGFRDLSHAFTLFAPSYKTGDPEKRGRFNLGEKLVIALADSVTVQSTKGGVEIDVRQNQRRMLRSQRERGTVFTAKLRMTREEVIEAQRAFFTLIPPKGIMTTYNGRELLQRQAIHSFEATLQTEIADDEGYLRRTRRRTLIEVYEPLEDETATIYEMGIPVVSTDDRYHVNILQKVPLNSDRDNVTPAFLRDVRTFTLNETAKLLTPEEAASNWVSDALEDDQVEPDAVEAVLTKRFGEKRVIFDPSDPEANRIAMSEGYTVIPGRSLSRDAWKNVKRFEVARPAGQVTPSPQPYSKDGSELILLPPEQWTEGISRIAEFAVVFAAKLGLGQIRVQIANDPTWPFNGTYGPSRELVLNVGTLGYAWFEQGVDERVLTLLLHEFGHYRGAQHLSADYHRALTRLGARATLAALEEPTLFKVYEGVIA